MNIPCSFSSSDPSYIHTHLNKSFENHIATFTFPGLLVTIILCVVHTTYTCSHFPKYMTSSSSSSSSSSSLMRKGVQVDEEKPHVLAVDDSLVDRKLIERLLTGSACRVTTAENGERALEFLGLHGQHRINRDSNINLIITDYCMPGMTGYELLKIVKESNLKEIPVVIVSSENIPTRIKKCLEGGAKEFMLKPLNQADVKKLRCYMGKFNHAVNSHYI